MTKLCIDCAHVRLLNCNYYCTKGTAHKRSKVTGKPLTRGVPAELERSVAGKFLGWCGPRGKFHKGRKEPLKSEYTNTIQTLAVDPKTVKDKPGRY